MVMIEISKSLSNLMMQQDPLSRSERHVTFVTSSSCHKGIAASKLLQNS